MSTAKVVIGTLASVALAGGIAWAAQRSSKAATAAPATAVRASRGAPVLVELFSSEGCSSCPPADKYLRDLDAQQPVSGATVVALEFHVDYWNYLGWTDPFSNPEFSERQREYGRKLNEPRIFTPELIVGGTYIANSDRHSTATRIAAAAHAPHATVTVARDGDSVNVHVEGVSAVDSTDHVEAWLAITEGGLVSRVDSGENQGRSLEHAPIVRRLMRLGAVESGRFAGSTVVRTETGWKPDQLRYVAFVQDVATGRVLGVGFMDATALGAKR